MRYKGGKCLAVNTTSASIQINTKWFNGLPETNQTVPKMSALWKLDNGSFTFNEPGNTISGVPNDSRGGTAPFYTVFAASRPPPSGFMGVPQAPKFHKFGRGKDVICNGVTAANGISSTTVQESGILVTGQQGNLTCILQAVLSSTIDDFYNDAFIVINLSVGTLSAKIVDYVGTTNMATLDIALSEDVGGKNYVITYVPKFKVQNASNQALAGSSAVIENRAEDANLMGNVSDSNGHGMSLKRLHEKLETQNKIKGIDYLTIPASSTVLTNDVVDILIPDGKTIPRITTAVASLVQFGNGCLIPEGGPNRFQPGLVPFLAGTAGYTPIWHILFAFYNCGRDDADRNNSHGVAATKNFSDWASVSKNVSNSGPPPFPIHSLTTVSHQDLIKELGYTPSDPSTFDPMQLSNNIKGNNCEDYICGKFPTSVNFRITNSELPSGEFSDDNSLLLTEAPPGCRQWLVKFSYR